MSPIDSLAQWYRQKALRSLPRAHPIEGPYRAEPQRRGWGEAAILLVSLLIFIAAIFGAFPAVA